jgi:hypothetical protein
VSEEGIANEFRNLAVSIERLFLAYFPGFGTNPCGCCRRKTVGERGQFATSNQDLIIKPDDND